MESDKIFLTIKSFLEHYEPNLIVVHNKSDNYYLNTVTTETNISEFFSAVQIKKSYVTFHLMPIYYFPELLINISQELQNKMQGKSCFNFKKTDDKLFAELHFLIKSCYEKYKSLNKI